MWTSSMLGAGGRRSFDLSGTFATNLDGWTASGFSRTTSNVRTAPGAAICGAGASYMEYLIPKATGGGLNIAASIWRRNTDGNGQIIALKYKIGSGSFVTLKTGAWTATYAQLSGTFANPGDDDVVIRVETETGTGGNLVDDWSISGS